MPVPVKNDHGVRRHKVDPAPAGLGGQEHHQARAGRALVPINGRLHTERGKISTHKKKTKGLEREREIVKKKAKVLSAFRYKIGTFLSSCSSF